MSESELSMIYFNKELKTSLYNLLIAVDKISESELWFEKETNEEK